VNEAEQIKKQLARYENVSAQVEVPEERAPVEAGGSLWDPLPSDWKPEPRYVKAEPDYSIGFKVGDLWLQSRWSDGHHERQALPHPNYEGKPLADPITPEMEETYWKKYQIWFDASGALERCIRLHLSIREFQGGSYSRPDKEELKQMFAEQWQWLKGLWTATPGMSEPAEKQLNTWADELRARCDAQQQKHGAAK